MMQSPYRHTPLTKSASGGDLVTGIIDKFNLLSVVDKDEERMRFEREVARLKAALDRSQSARDEAESEALTLRESIAGLRDDTQNRTKDLQERVAEYERKYDKAKERFKQLRRQNEENIQKIEHEHLETEKVHWRTVAAAQEEAAWERSLREQACALLDFVCVEHRVEKEILARRPAPTPMIAPAEAVDTLCPQQEPLPRSSSADAAIDDSQTIIHSPVEDPTLSFLAPRTGRRSSSYRSRNKSRRSSVTPPLDTDHSPSTLLVTPTPIPTIVESESALDDDHSEPHNLNVDTVTPARLPQGQHKIAVDFGDEEAGEDKENQTPRHFVPRSGMPKTPLTIDRAAALAAIQYRRGRAQSFVNAHTPGRLAVGDRRDVSAPPLVSLAVGR